MPIYDYRCACGKEVKDHLKKMADPAPVCCDQPMVQMFNTKVYVYDPDMVFEHIAHTPMKFRDKKDLRNYCRANGMTSHYAE